jgi:predicted permease
MGVGLIAGRGFTENDGVGQLPVMLINETMARSGFLGENPIGKQVYAIGKAPWEIVGIVEDVRQFGLDQTPGAQVFVDFRQMPPPVILGDATYFAVRTEQNPTVMASRIRDTVRQLDRRSAAVDYVATMDELVSNSISRPRLYAVLLGIFGGVGVLLAAIGVYGVIAYAVTQRTREIGIRIALGARRSEVIELVIKQGLILTGVGIALGVGGAAALTRYLDRMLFGLTPLDPATFVGVSVLFGAVATLASYVPARRATKVDPLVALRCD